LVAHRVAETVAANKTTANFTVAFDSQQLTVNFLNRLRYQRKDVLRNG
jgi:hypothetical protein